MISPLKIDLGRGSKSLIDLTRFNDASIHNAATVRAYPIPLPPLAEQHRIVAKVDELMSLCYQLEAQITVTEQNSRRFLESVLAEALAPGGNVTAEAEVA